MSRWKWLRRLTRWRAQPMAQVPRHDEGAASGRDAREAAESSLDQARARWPEVHRVAGSLRDLRERNHFAEQIQHIFEGGSRS